MGTSLAPPERKILASERPCEPENRMAAPLDVLLTMAQNFPALPQPTHHRPSGLQIPAPLVLTCLPLHPRVLPPGELLQVVFDPVVTPRLGDASGV